MKKSFTVLILLIITSMLITSCSSKDQDTPARTTGNPNSIATASISLAADATTITDQGQAIITAAVTEANGAPSADGTSVTFTLSDSAAGTLSKEGVSTTNNGTAVVTFTPAKGKTGTVQISASSRSVNKTISITVTAAQTMVISLQADSASIATGGKAQITAHVVDGTGNLAPDGTIVAFSLDNGLKGTLQSSTRTTSGGDATVTFTAGTLSTAAVITATVGGVSANIVVSITGGAAASILAAASATSIEAGKTATVTATVTDSLDAPVSGATVTFALSDASKASLSASAVKTDASGVATVTVTGIEGPYVTVDATCLAVSSSTSINITGSASVGSLVVSSSLTSVVIGGSSVITALLRDASNMPIYGATVNFALSNTSAGSLGSATAVTGASGAASVTFTAGSIQTSAVASASYSALALTSTVNLTVTAPPPAEIVSTATPTTITVRGTTTITAVVKDGNGDPVLDGTPVNFTLSDSSFGTLSNTVSSTAGGTGTATITLTASNKAGAVTVSAVAGTITKTTTIVVEPAPTGSIQFVSAVPQVIGIKGSGQIETSSVTFLVNDITGNPVTDGTSVSFSMKGPGGNAYIGATPGSLTASGSTINGAATVILNSGSVAGTVTITASTQNALGATISSSASQISIGGGVPSAGRWSLSVETGKISQTGLSVAGLDAKISGFISDRFGNYNVLEGTAVNFYTEGGAIDRQGITDKTGQTSVVLETGYSYPLDVTKAAAADAVSNRYFGGYAEPWYPGSTYDYNPRDGWVTVLVTTMGEEAFLDENGNGLLTRSYGSSACPPGYTCECDDNGTAGTYAGCVTRQTGGPSVCNSAVTTCVDAGFAGSKRSEGFVDLGEPFYDKNDDAARDDGLVAGSPFEEFIDADHDGVYDEPNGVWDGPGCQSAGCLNSKMVWKDLKLTFTHNVFTFWPKPDLNNCYDTAPPCAAAYANAGASMPYAEAPVSIQKGGSGTFCVKVADANLNSPPGGTTITAAASPGTVTPASVTLLDALSRGPAGFCFSVSISDTETKSSTVVSTSIGGSEAVALLTVPLSLPPAPAAPTGVSATALPNAGEIRLSWNPVTGATSYNIYYSAVAGVTKLNGIKVSPSPTTSPSDVTGLADNTTYYFVVTAVGTGGESAESAQKSATTIIP